MSGKAPVFTWPQWVFKDLQVRGFNLRKWMTVPKGTSSTKAQEEKKSEEIKRMITLLAQLVNDDKLSIDYTEYELSVDFAEALEHSQARTRAHAQPCRVAAGLTGSQNAGDGPQHQGYDEAQRRRRGVLAPRCLP